MATVYAITPIVHGKGLGDEYERMEFEVGAKLTNKDFSDAELASLVSGGSAVEVGTGRKYSEEPTASMTAGAVDNDATLLRDQLIAQSRSVGDNVPQPTANTANTNESTGAPTANKDTPPPAPVK